MSRRFCLPSCQPITPFRTVGRFSAPAFSLLRVPDMSYRCSASLPRCWYAFCASAFPDFLLTSPAFICYTQGGRSKASGSPFFGGEQRRFSGGRYSFLCLDFAVSHNLRGCFGIFCIAFNQPCDVLKVLIKLCGGHFVQVLTSFCKSWLLFRLISSAIPDFYNFLTAS